jgi:ribosomal protein S18 acetylase RimI-like enzyme
VNGAFRFLLFTQSRSPGDDFSRLDPLLRDWLMRQQFAGQSASYRAQYPNTRFEIMEWDASPIGRIITNRTPEAVLVDIALDVTARNRGIGTTLMRAVIDGARAAGLPVRHTVFASNPAALLFYLRLGFKAVESTEINTTLEWREPSYPEERMRRLSRSLRLPLSFDPTWRGDGLAKPEPGPNT